MSDRNSNRVEETRQDKKKIVKERRKFNEFSIVNHLNGYLVKNVPVRGSTVYCDNEELWLRSKKPMKPMTYDSAREMVGKFIEEDMENQKHWRN